MVLGVFWYLGCGTYAEGPGTWVRGFSNRPWARNEGPECWMMGPETDFLCGCKVLQRSCSVTYIVGET